MVIIPVLSTISWSTGGMEVKCHTFSILWIGCWVHTGSGEDENYPNFVGHPSCSLSLYRLGCHGYK